MGIPFKDPGADLDYERSWAKWLTKVGDTIVASEWTLPDGLELGSGGAGHFTDTTTTVWIKGGTPGRRYRVINTITTAEGRVDVRSFFITIRRR